MPTLSGSLRSGGGLSEEDLLAVLCHGGAALIRLALRIGANCRRPRAHRVKPAAQVRKVVEVLLLPFPRYDPRVGRDVGDRVALASDKTAAGEPPVEDAVKPVRLADVTAHSVRDLLWRVLDEVMVLSCHRAEPAHLPKQPFHNRLSPAHIVWQEKAGLLGEIAQ